MAETVEEIVIGLIDDFIEDWGLDDIEVTKDTMLKGNIGFDSSDTMQLFAMIQEHYNGMDFHFQELVMDDNKYIDDLSIGQVVVFVLRKLSSITSAAAEG